MIGSLDKLARAQRHADASQLWEGSGFQVCRVYIEATVIAALRGGRGEGGRGLYFLK